MYTQSATHQLHSMHFHYSLRLHEFFLIYATGLVKKLTFCFGENWMVNCFFIKCVLDTMQVLSSFLLIKVTGSI